MFAALQDSPGSAEPLASIADQASQDDAETSFNLARTAVSAGDVRGAIAAFERVLQVNPDLANIKLELGLLYLRVGQADLARSYLEAAVDAADAPEEARQRARQALRVSNGLSRPWSVHGTLFLGGQYQTNPNGSPNTVSVIGPFGEPILVSGDQLRVVGGDDYSAAATANLEVAYGIGNQRGDALVADLDLAQNEYAKTNELDASYVNLRLGPRFNFGRPIDPTGYIRPFASGTILTLDRSGYYYSYGGGLEALGRATLNLTITGQLSYERRDFRNSETRPRARDQTGDYWLGVGDISWQIATRVRLNAGSIVEHVDAREAYWSRTSYGPRFGLTAVCTAPVGSIPWVVRFGGQYRRSDYKEADPFVDAVRARAEDRYDIDAAINIPLTSTIALDFRAQQSWNRANFPNYRYKNSFGSFGLNYRF